MQPTTSRNHVFYTILIYFYGYISVFYSLDFQIDFISLGSKTKILHIHAILSVETKEFMLRCESKTQEDEMALMWPYFQPNFIKMNLTKYSVQFQKSNFKLGSSLESTSFRSLVSWTHTLITRKLVASCFPNMYSQGSMYFL